MTWTYNLNVKADGCILKSYPLSSTLTMWKIIRLMRMESYLVMTHCCFLSTTFSQLIVPWLVVFAINCSCSGVKGCPHVEIFCLYPHGRVSDIQVTILSYLILSYLILSHTLLYACSVPIVFFCACVRTYVRGVRRVNVLSNNLKIKKELLHCEQDEKHSRRFWFVAIFLIRPKKGK